VFFKLGPADDSTLKKCPSQNLSRGGDEDGLFGLALKKEFSFKQPE
jgi:hypothetical protein